MVLASSVKNIPARTREKIFYLAFIRLYLDQCFHIGIPPFKKGADQSETVQNGNDKRAL